MISESVNVITKEATSLLPLPHLSSLPRPFSPTPRSYATPPSYQQVNLFSSCCEPDSKNGLLHTMGLNDESGARNVICRTQAITACDGEKEEGGVGGAGGAGAGEGQEGGEKENEEETFCSQ